MSECFISFPQLLKCQSDAKHLSVSCVYNGGTILHETSFLKICFYYSQLFCTQTKGRWTFSSNLFQQNMQQHSHNWLLFDLEFIKLFSDSVVKQRKDSFFFLFSLSMKTEKQTSKESVFVVAVFVSVRGERYVTIMFLFFGGWGGSVKKYLVLNFPILTTFIWPQHATATLSMIDSDACAILTCVRALFPRTEKFHFPRIYYILLVVYHYKLCS